MLRGLSPDGLSDSFWHSNFIVPFAIINPVGFAAQADFNCLNFTRNGLDWLL